MYYAVNLDENDEPIMNFAGAEGWAMDSDLAQELVSDGYMQENDGTFTGRNGERVAIVER